MENKVVFITGGDKGIGRGIATYLAHRYKTIIITYNQNKDGANHLADMYDNIIVYQCNLLEKKSIMKVAHDVITRYGGVDILINNAGYENDAIFAKMQPEQWESVIRINLESIYYFAHYFIPSMVANRWGRIVNFSSIAGFTGVYGKSNYATAKAGIVGFTKSLAQEFGAKGITINAIAPGAIQTDMLMRIPQKYRDKILENIPSHEFGSVEDAAYLVEFLISDKSRYINGQTIHLNGGSYCL